MKREIVFKQIIVLSIIILFSTNNHLFCQGDVNLDWKLHNVGKVIRPVSNMGGDLNAKNAGTFGYRSLLYCEYPPDSYEEHIGEAGIWVGAIVEFNSIKDTLVSVTTSWNSNFEFYPTNEPYDTVWVVGRGDTVEIPYLGRYIGISDQDFVCRYNDYGPVSRRISNHKPLYIDVIQTSFAWGSTPLDEVLVYTYYIIPVEKELNNVFIAYWMDANVGYRGTTWDFGRDDITKFLPERHISLHIDPPGGVDGTAISPLVVRIFPPEDYKLESDADTLIWTYYNYTGANVSPSSRDSERYLEMCSGIRSPDEEILWGGTESMIAFGPLTLHYLDTLKFSVGLVLGNGLEGVMKNLETLERIVAQNFKVPSPPPAPKVYVETDSRVVKLIWKRLNDDDPDPENYFDPYRADNSEKPFEGYRVYKRTRKSTPDGRPVPWTLLAEYDLPDNIFFNNTGIRREYVDYGLLNNVEYYYAVTAFSKPDTALPFPSQESSISLSSVTAIPGTAPPERVGKVAVVPNPYRGDVDYFSYNPPWEKPPGGRSFWMEQDRRIQFINLPPECEIRIYTLAGDPVETIDHSNPHKGYEDWNLTSSVGQAVASGIYLFTVEDKRNGEVQVGKFVIIK